MKKICLLISIALVLIFTSLCVAGTIVTHDIDSPSIAKNTLSMSSVCRVLVYLPDGYDNSNQRYPVIYWICGWGATATGGGDLSDEYRQPLDDAIKAGKIPPTIAVFLDGGRTYLNSVDFGYWDDFITKELVSFIDKTYRTYPYKERRAIMGHSMGGYSAMMLAMLHPDVWGAAGSNDGSSWINYYDLYIGKEQEIPAQIRGLAPYIKFNWNNVPAKIEDYKTIRSDDYLSAICMQLGTSISPNPDVPLHFDVPVKNDKIVPDVIEKWREYCLIDPTTIAKNRSTLSNLSMIAIIIPTGGATNREFNIILINMLKAEGISPTRLDMPGQHNDFRRERFIALAENLLPSMKPIDSISSVNLKNKLSATWGQIKIGY